MVRRVSQLTATAGVFAARQRPPAGTGPALDEARFARRDVVTRSRRIVAPRIVPRFVTCRCPKHRFGSMRFVFLVCPLVTFDCHTTTPSFAPVHVVIARRARRREAHARGRCWGIWGLSSVPLRLAFVRESKPVSKRGLRFMTVDHSRFRSSCHSSWTPPGAAGRAQSTSSPTRVVGPLRSNGVARTHGCAPDAPTASTIVHEPQLRETGPAVAEVVPSFGCGVSGLARGRSPIDGETSGLARA